MVAPLVEHEPLAEAAHRDLIRRLAQAGDRPAALAVADALAERLRRELRVPLGAETRALVDEVRRGLVGTTAPSAQPPLPAPLARTARPEGRETPLARLQAAWGDAGSGTLRIAVAAGEPGIGKTTLLGELARRVHADGGAVLFGRSDEHGLLPYQPWVEALERHLSDLPAVERERRLGDGALARLLPSLGGVEDAADAPGERYRAFEAVRAVLEAAAEERPVLLVLDDLQWADRDSLHLLRHLSRMAHGARLLVAISVRQAELSPAAATALTDLRREGPLVHLTLTGLDEEAVAAVLAQHGADGDAAAYRERTGGNPFFLDELLRDEAEHGGEPGGPPPGVRDVIGRRLARLSPAARAALELGAAQGLEFEPLLLVAGTDPDGAALDGLAAAVAAGLVVKAGPHRYGFAHALIRDTLVADMAPSRRASLHLRIADALALRDGRHAGEIARHVRFAGPLAPSARRITAELAAARQAECALAYADAADHYAAALDAGTPDRAEVLLALGAARDRAGCRPGARRAFAEVAELARAARDPRLLARAALGHGGVGVLVAAPDAPVTTLLAEALAALPVDERALSARVRARLAIEYYYPDRAGAQALSARAVDDARAAGDPAALAAALNARRVALWVPERAEERLEAATEMVAAAQAAGDLEGVLQGRNWRVVDLMELGRRRELDAEIDAYAELANAVGLAHYRWFVPLWRAILALLAGRWDEAEAFGDSALALGAQADDQMAPWLVNSQREFALDLRGRLRETSRDWLEEQATTSAEPWAWLSYLARRHTVHGNPERAREIVSQLTRDGGSNLPDGVNWHTACDLAEAIAELGARDAAAVVHARLAPHARLFGVIARGGVCLGSTEYYLARLAGTLGRLDEAEARMRRAVTENTRVGAPACAIRALHRLGELVAERGDPEGGRELLLKAAAQADELAMPMVADMARTSADATLALSS